jgi:hypothetical protein
MAHPNHLIEESEFINYSSFQKKIDDVIELVEKYHLKKYISDKDYSIELELSLQDIENDMNKLEYDVDLKRSLKTFARILTRHRDNSIPLLKPFYVALFNCNKPDLINDLFKQGIIRNEYFKSILSNRYLLDVIHDRFDYGQCVPIVASVLILMYRIDTKIYKNKVFSYGSDAVYYILQNDSKVKPREILFNLLIKSHILNGIMNKHDLQEFLNRLLLFNQGNFDSHEVQINKPLLLQEFPLSLKSIVRMTIKNSLGNNYNQRNVNYLPLPVNLKDFILFENEINEILDNKFV